jgi:hypothetical protein
VKLLRTLAGVLLLVSISATADAQTEGKFALGADFALKVPGGPDAHGSEGVGFLWRFGRGKEGFGFHWGLNWYETHIDRSIAGREVELGELHVKPVMAGYGYTHNVGRYSVTAALLAGVAYSSVSLTPAAHDAYRDLLGARSVDVDSGWPLVLRPELSVWYDINKKLGLHVSSGYMIARPNVTVTSTLGEDKRRISADMLGVKVGLAYSIF